MFRDFFLENIVGFASWAQNRKQLWMFIFQTLKQSEGNWTEIESVATVKLFNGMALEGENAGSFACGHIVCGWGEFSVRWILSFVWWQQPVFSCCFPDVEISLPQISRPRCFRQVRAKSRIRIQIDSLQTSWAKELEGASFRWSDPQTCRLRLPPDVCFFFSGGWNVQWAPSRMCGIGGWSRDLF